MQGITQCSCCMMEVCTHVALTAVDSWATTNQGHPQVNFKCEQKIDRLLVNHYKLWASAPPCSTNFLCVCGNLPNRCENVGEQCHYKVDVFGFSIS